MSEMVRLWIERLYKDAIENAKEDIRNEHLWELGYSGQEPFNPHTENIKMLKEYIDILTYKLNELDKEQL